MMTTRDTRSNQPQTLSLQQLEQERLTRTRAQIFRRRERERLEYDRRRAAEQPRDPDERVLIARCPTCGDVLERTVIHTNN